MKSATQYLASPISRIGGKYNYLAWLLPQIPEKEKSIYVEPFWGSGVVLLNRAVSQLEVVNDFDRSLIRFMRVLQNKELLEELRHRLSYTLYSKEEYSLAVDQLKSSEFRDEVDFAWSYFTAIRQSFCKKDGWGREIKIRQQAIFNSTRKWFSGISNIDRFVDRISHAQIENDTAENVIRRYDSADTIFYCDPPYLPETRNGGVYANEMTLEDHRRLLELLLTCKGVVCLSGYPSVLYNEMLSGWTLTKKDVLCQLGRNSPTGIKDAKRVECLWRNPKAMEYFCQQTLF